MAMLKDILVNGKLKITGTIYTSSLNLDGINITINTAAISGVTAGHTVGAGLCTAEQVKTYIAGLRG